MNSHSCFRPAVRALARSLQVFDPYPPHPSRRRRWGPLPCCVHFKIGTMSVVAEYCSDAMGIWQLRVGGKALNPDVTRHLCCCRYRDGEGASHKLIVGPYWPHMLVTLGTVAAITALVFGVAVPATGAAVKAVGLLLALLSNVFLLCTALADPGVFKVTAALSSRREETRRDETRREETRATEKRREEKRREEKRREEKRREEKRREEKRREEKRREEKREGETRGGTRRSGCAPGWGTEEATAQRTLPTNHNHRSGRHRSRGAPPSSWPASHSRRPSRPRRGTSRSGSVVALALTKKRTPPLLVRERRRVAGDRASLLFAASHRFVARAASPMTTPHANLSSLLSACNSRDAPHRCFGGSGRRSAVFGFVARSARRGGPARGSRRFVFGSATRSRSDPTGRESASPWLRLYSRIVVRRTTTAWWSRGGDRRYARVGGRGVGPGNGCIACRVACRVAARRLPSLLSVCPPYGTRSFAAPRDRETDAVRAAPPRPPPSAAPSRCARSFASRVARCPRGSLDLRSLVPPAAPRRHSHMRLSARALPNPPRMLTLTATLNTNLTLNPNPNPKPYPYYPPTPTTPDSNADPLSVAAGTPSSLTRTGRRARSTAT